MSQDPATQVKVWELNGSSRLRIGQHSLWSISESLGIRLTTHFPWAKGRFAVRLLTRRRIFFHNPIVSSVVSSPLVFSSAHITNTRCRFRSKIYHKSGWPMLFFVGSHNGAGSSHLDRAQSRSGFAYGRLSCPETEIIPSPAKILFSCGKGLNTLPLSPYFVDTNIPSLICLGIEYRAQHTSAKYVST